MDTAFRLLVTGQEVGGGEWGLLTVALLWLAGPGSKELPSSLFLSSSFVSYFSVSISAGASGREGMAMSYNLRSLLSVLL